MKLTSIRPNEQCAACFKPLQGDVCLWRAAGDERTSIVHEMCGVKLQYDMGVWYEGFDLVTSEDSSVVAVTEGRFTVAGKRRFIQRSRAPTDQHVELHSDGKQRIVLSTRSSSRRGQVRAVSPYLVATGRDLPLWDVTVEGGRIVEKRDLRGECYHDLVLEDVG